MKTKPWDVGVWTYGFCQGFYHQIKDWGRQATPFPGPIGDWEGFWEKNMWKLGLVEWNTWSELVIKWSPENQMSKALDTCMTNVPSQMPSSKCTAYRLTPALHKPHLIRFNQGWKNSWQAAGQYFGVQQWDGVKVGRCIWIFTRFGEGYNGGSQHFWWKRV